MASAAWCALAWMLAASSSTADTIIVTSLDDDGAGSLRDAIRQTSPNDLITIASGLSGTITLTNGELLIDKELTIVGPVGAKLLVSGNKASRVFRATGGVVTLSNLVILKGYCAGAGGGILNVSSNTLFLGNCTISNNVSYDNNGGAIANYGRLVLNNCTLAGNLASLGGSGGGIYNLRGTLFATNCTLWANKSTSGGGIYNYGGTETLQNCTLSLNLAASTGGGIFSGDNLPAIATNYIGSTIVANNHVIFNEPDDVEGNFISNGYNLIGFRMHANGFDAVLFHDQYGDITPLDPLLGPLQDNGGPTPTGALLPGSPAIDNGNARNLPADQRGGTRQYDDPSLTNQIGGDGSDIGAFEWSPYRPLLTIRLSGDSTVLSWPSDAAGFTLQAAGDLSSPDQWVDASDAPGLVGDHYFLTNSTAAGTMFYRLNMP